MRTLIIRKTSHKVAGKCHACEAKGKRIWGITLGTTYFAICDKCFDALESKRHEMRVFNMRESR